MAPLIILVLALAWFDSIHTRFMLQRHGIDKELNPVIKWLSRKLGITYGVWIGILVPTLVCLYLGIFFRPFLEMLLFARLMLFFLQANHLRTELAFIRERSHPISR